MRKIHNPTAIDQESASRDLKPEAPHITVRMRRARILRQAADPDLATACAALRNLARIRHEAATIDGSDIDIGDLAGQAAAARPRLHGGGPTLEWEFILDLSTRAGGAIRNVTRQWTVPLASRLHIRATVVRIDSK